MSLPNPVMIHDCAITEHHTIILDFPLLLNGFRFDDSTPSRFGVMPRHATSSDEICWIEAPAAYAFHVANSWEEETPDGTVIRLLCGATPHLDMIGLGGGAPLGRRSRP